MKANLHPNWQDCTVTCACGNSFTTKGTIATMQVDICSKCHPFFTGEERFVDKEGRLDKFKNKMALSAKLKAEEKAKQIAKQAKKTATVSNIEKLSFKQILNQAKNETNKKAEEEVTQAELLEKSAK